MNSTISGQRILVNIPILNEIDNIHQLVTGIQAAIGDLDYTLLFVDDGSTDGTLEYLSDIVETSQGRIVILPRRKTVSGCQRGAALLAGVKWALANGNFDIFVEMDGDLSHRPEELRSGIEVIASGAADVVIASKYVPGSVITGRTPARTLISIVCNTAVRALVHPGVLDFSNGFRYYNLTAARLVPRYRIRYGSPIYLTEVMAIWASHNMRVAEIPSHYIGRHKGASKVRVRDYAEAVIGIIEIALRYRTRRFQLANDFYELETEAGGKAVAASVDS